MAKIDPRFVPMPLHRALADPAEVCDLGEGEAAEKLEIDDLRDLRLHGGELVERLAEPFDLIGIARRGRVAHVLAVDRGHLEAAAALSGLTATEAVDDQAAHDPCRIGEEPGAIGERQILALRDVEIGLVEQAGRAERSAWTRARQLAAGEPAELPVERRKERLGGLADAAIGGEQQSRKRVFHRASRRYREEERSRCWFLLTPRRYPPEGEGLASRHRCFPTCVCRLRRGVRLLCWIPSRPECARSLRSDL